jgi:hypothetical protein
MTPMPSKVRGAVRASSKRPRMTSCLNWFLGRYVPPSVAFYVPPCARLRAGREVLGREVLHRWSAIRLSARYEPVQTP